MGFACAALSLSPSWQAEMVILVRATDAIRLCRQGEYQAIPWRRAPASLERLGRRDLGRAREFVGKAGLTRLPLSSLRDETVLEILRTAIANQELAVLVEGEGAGAAEGSSAQRRRLVRQIEAKTRGRMTYLGRQYKLVTDVDLSKLPDRDSYEVEAQATAAQVLEALAHQPAVDAELAGWLLRAREQLTRDWRPPLAPDGLVLLHRIRVPLASPDAGTALTPSQLKAMLKKTEWIEIEVVDHAGEPYTGPYRLEYPDSSSTTGVFDEKGFWANYDIQPGNCKLFIGNLGPVKPDGVPPVDDRGWVAVRLVDGDGKAIQGRSYVLRLTDGTENRGTTSDGPIRVEGLTPGTCLFSLLPAEGTAAAHPDIEVEDDSPIDVGRGVLEVDVHDLDGQLLVNHKFEAHFPDGTVRNGVTDANGRIHLEGCPSEKCRLRFIDAE